MHSCLTLLITCSILIPKVVPQLIVIWAWTKWSQNSACMIGRCISRKAYSSQPSINQEDSLDPTDLVCRYRDSRTSIEREYVNVEDKNGLSHKVKVFSFKQRGCSKKLGIVYNECGKGELETLCMPCSSSSQIYRFNSSNSLPFCSQSNWLYKLVAAVFAFFLTLGMLLLMYRLLQSLNCKAFRINSNITSRTTSNNRNSLPTNCDLGVNGSDMRGLYQHYLPISTDDKLPNYDDVVRNPDIYALGPNSQPVAGAQSSQQQATPPAYNESVIGFIDSTPIASPRAGQQADVLQTNASSSV